MPFRNGNEPANKKNLDEEPIRELYRSGLSTNKIGERLGCRKSLIVRVIRKYNDSVAIVPAFLTLTVRRSGPDLLRMVLEISHVHSALIHQRHARA